MSPSSFQPTHRQRARRWRPLGWQPSGIITLLTDFGAADVYAGILEGVILSIAPDCRPVTLTHQVPAQAVEVGSMLLRSAVSYFPEGSVHLAVVDPGVGSDRDPILVVTEKGLLVGPDNGLMHAAALDLGLVEVRRLECDDLFLKPVSHTFHGRDVFAPVAAHLAGGKAPQHVGPVVPGMKELDGLRIDERDGKIVGRVVYIDGFGNLITDIPADRLDRASTVELGELTLPGIADSYAAVAEGAPVALIGSWGSLEIGCNGASAARTLGAQRGDPVTVERGGS